MLIPWRRLLGSQRGVAACTLPLPQGHGTPYPSLSGRLAALVFCAHPQGAWAGSPAGSMGEGRKTGFFLFR